ncbi:MAG: hypothetical protein NTY19_32330 [Planctomycetota bacterium]|nr:hypothetical protein [Planctomycetota bacterium]
MRLVLPDRGLELLDAGIAIFGPRRQRLVGNVQQLAGSVGRSDLVPGGCMHAAHDVLTVVGRIARDDLKQDRAQEVHVAGRTDHFHRTGGHFGRHVGRRSAHARRLCNAARFQKQRGRQGDPPIHHQDFAKVTQHHVFGFQIAMNDAAGVGKRNRVRDTQQESQVVRHCFAVEYRRPGRAVDTFHGIKQRAGFICAQVVDRYDVGVFQIAGHDRLGQEFHPVIVVVLDLGLEHLESDGAVNRSLPGRVDDADATLTDDAEQLIVGGSGFRLAGRRHRPALHDQARSDRGPTGRTFERHPGSGSRRDTPSPHLRHLIEILAGQLARGGGPRRTGRDRQR